MTQLLTWSFWLSLNPPTLTPVANRLWGAIAMVALLAGILVHVLLVRRAAQAFAARAWARVTHFLAVNGVLLLVLYFFRYEGVPFFDARFWLLILGIGDIVWAVAIARHFFVKLPAQRRSWEEERRKRKYLK